MVSCPDSLDVLEQHAQVYNLIHQLFLIGYEHEEELECANESEKA